MRRMTAFALSLIFIVSLLPASYAETTLPAVLRVENRTLGASLAYSSQTIRHPTAGRVEERVFTLSPGHGLTPVSVTGNYLYKNQLNLAEAAAHLSAQGRTVVAGMNANFFNTTYYTPNGLLVEDGILKGMDMALPALGFMSDGSAVIGTPSISISVTSPSRTIRIDRLNLVRSDEGGLYLYSSDFSENTRTTRAGRHVVLTIVDGGRLRVGQTLNCTVKEILTGTEAYTIGKDELVLSATAAEPVSRTDGLAVGNAVTVDVTSKDPIWSNVVQGIGGYHMLLENGVITPGLDKSYYAPRTVVGLKPDGSVVFMAVDGRQKNYSAGLTLPQAAQRLIDYGCVTAMELDGGGSTTAGITYPGKQNFEIINKPSDGGLRRCSSFIMFVNDRTPTGYPAALHLYGSSRVLVGSELSYTVLATDTAGFPVAVPENVVLLPGTNSEILPDGLYARFSNPGYASVQAHDLLTGIGGLLPITVESALDSLALLNSDGKALPSELSVKSGQSQKLTLKGTRNGFDVAVSGGAAQWTATGEIGYAAASLFTATTQPLATGTLTASAGGLNASVPVRITNGAAVLADFEGTFPLPTQGSGMTAEPSSRRVKAARGLGAAMLSYSFTDGIPLAFLPLDTPLKDRPGNLHLWLKGDGSENSLTLWVQDSTGASHEVPLGTLSDSEYHQLAVALPANSATLTGLTLQNAGGAPAEGAFYTDHWVQSWSTEPDNDAPGLTLLAQEETENGTVYRVQIADNAGPPSAARISVMLDGALTVYSYNESTGIAQFTAAKAEGLSVYTITAQDSFGGYGRLQIRHIGTPLPQSQDGAVDIGNSWGTETMRYLDARGLLVCTERDGQRFFEPKRAVKRIEIFEMLLLMTGVDPSAYHDTDAPFVDLDGLTEQQQDIAKASFALGYIAGRPSAAGPLLAPNSDLTRAELCTLLVQSSKQGLGTGALTFEDVPEIPAYALDPVTRLAANGLVSGVGGNRFLPNGTIDREQTVQLLLHLFI